MEPCNIQSVPCNIRKVVYMEFLGFLVMLFIGSIAYRLFTGTDPMA